MASYTSPQDGSTLDGYVFVGSTNNWSTSTIIAIGEYNTNSNVYRGLFQFPGLTDGSIPDGAVVKGAKLYLKIKTDYSSNARTLSAYRSKRAVVISQCTNTIYKTGSNWAEIGGFGTADCEQTPIGSLSLGADETVDTWIEIDLDATAIQEIIDGTWTTPTFYLKMATEANDGYAYYSTEDTTASNRPYIVVDLEGGGSQAIWWG